MLGRRKILYLDDDAMLRKATSIFLGKVGCEVEAASDGIDALERYQRAGLSGAPFDLVILDLSIPGGMGGVETMQRLREFDPEVKAIITSGYPNDPSIQEYERLGFTGAMVKPYTIQDLNATVESAFEK